MYPVMLSGDARGRQTVPLELSTTCDLKCGSRYTISHCCGYGAETLRYCNVMTDDADDSALLILNWRECKPTSVESVALGTGRPKRAADQT